MFRARPLVEFLMLWYCAAIVCSCRPVFLCWDEIRTHKHYLSGSTYTTTHFKYFDTKPCHGLEKLKILMYTASFVLGSLHVSVEFWVLHCYGVVLLIWVCRTKKAGCYYSRWCAVSRVV